MKRFELELVGEYDVKVDFNPLFQPSRLTVTLRGPHTELTLQFKTPVAIGNFQAEVNKEVRSIPFLTTTQQSDVIQIIMDRAKRYEGIFID